MQNTNGKSRHIFLEAQAIRRLVWGSEGRLPAEKSYVRGAVSGLDSFVGSTILSIDPETNLVRGPY